MKSLFFCMRELLNTGSPFALQIIVEASGSTPRGAGAAMIAGSEGRIWGTIGGALAEHLAVEDAKELVRKRGGCVTRNYKLGPEEDAADGEADVEAQCGGEITVFSRYMDAADTSLCAFAEKGIECFAGKEGTWLIVEVAHNGVDGAGLCLASQKEVIVSVGDLPENAAALLGEGSIYLEQKGRLWFSMPLAAPGFVYIFGGGHVAQELVPLLDRLGFRCVVFDDRAEFTRPELFPGAAGIIPGDFSRIADSVSLEAADYAVIVTRGHRWDFDAEAFALRTSAAYIGVIGSAAKHAFVRRRLLSAGFTESEIDAPRVHAPIGVSIGSKTPAEVAVSIAAELIRVRSGSRS